MKKIDEALFKNAMSQFASGVTVITASSEGQDHGMTASAFCSLSLDPPLVLVCVKRENRMWHALKKSAGFGVHLLSREQESLSNRFAGGIVDEEGKWRPWPPDRDKFADLEIARGRASEAPLFSGALATLDCLHHDALDGGDHTIFVGRIVEASAQERGATEPLLYFSGRYCGLGAN